jgi:hypothetical protein
MSSPIGSRENEASSNILHRLRSYAAPSLAASVAMIPIFGDMINKSNEQMGKVVTRIRLIDGFKGGVKAAPMSGMMIGTEINLQKYIERKFIGDPKHANLLSLIASSAAVGLAASPFIAIFNGQTMGWTIPESFRKISTSQILAIVFQETGFVGGLGAGDLLGDSMKLQLGGSAAVEYGAAFVSGVLGSLAGHPGNTALTRWQSGMKVDNIRQLMWGAPRKARATGVFAVIYKGIKDTLLATDV